MVNDDDADDPATISISTAHEVRGIYAHEDEAAEFLRSGWPKFETSEACKTFATYFDSYERSPP